MWRQRHIPFFFFVCLQALSENARTKTPARKRRLVGTNFPIAAIAADAMPVEASRGQWRPVEAIAANFQGRGPSVVGSWEWCYNGAMSIYGVD
jgi:hypothetical protein